MWCRDNIGIPMQVQSPQIVSCSHERSQMELGVIVLVTERYISTGILRSLGRQGVPVYTIGGKSSVKLFSRYSSRSMCWPNEADESKVEFLESLAAQQGLTGWGLFLTTDQDVKFVGQYHRRLAKHFRLTTPSFAESSWAYDKRLTYRLADKLRVDHPWTISPANRLEVEKLCCLYPVILKPTVKEVTNSFTLARAWRVNTHEELLRRYDEACHLVHPNEVMIQDWIPGGVEGNVSVGAICDAGKVIGSLVVKKTRSYPIDFSQGSTAVQTTSQPECQDAVWRLLSATRHTGPIEMEFKFDPRTGQYKLLDVNPRLWLWHSIGPLAGVDFPYLLWKLILGEAVVTPKGSDDVRWIRMSGDMRAVFQEILAGTFSPVKYLNSLRTPLSFSMFAIDDPLPGLLQLPYKVFRRVWKHEPSKKIEDPLLPAVRIGTRVR